MPRVLNGPALLPAGFAALLLTAPGAAMAAGMPQLDFSTPLTTSQVIWGVLIFIVLYLLLSRWSLPQVRQVLAERAAAIEADLNTARAAKERADAAAAEVAEAVGLARAEAQAAINAAVDQAKQEAAAQALVLNQRLEAQLQEAEQRIGVARSSAMGALRAVATETAGSIIQRLTGATPDPHAVEGAVGAALAARES